METVAIRPRGLNDLRFAGYVTALIKRWSNRNILRYPATSRRRFCLSQNWPTNGAFRERRENDDLSRQATCPTCSTCAARNAVVKARSQSARSMTVSQYKAYGCYGGSQFYQGGRVPIPQLRWNLPRGPVGDALHSLLAAALRGHTMEDRVHTSHDGACPRAGTH